MEGPRKQKRSRGRCLSERIWYLDCASWDVEQVLSLHKDIVPKASLLVALHLRQVEVGTCNIKTSDAHAHHYLPCQQKHTALSPLNGPVPVNGHAHPLSLLAC